MRSRAVTVIACLVAFATTAASAFAAPGNGMLAAVVDGKIVTLNQSGDGQRTLFSGTDLSGLAWSPDGNKLAFASSGRILVYDLPNARAFTLTVPPAGATDSNAAWSPDGSRVSFRRVLESGAQETDSVLAADGSDLRRTLLGLSVLQLAFSPDLTRTAVITPLRWLIVSGVGLELARDAVGVPAWSPNGERVAYVDEDDDQGTPAGLRITTTEGFGASNHRVAPPPVGSPRWAPDGNALVYVVNGGIRTVATEAGSTPKLVDGLANVTSVDWQPCTPGVSFADCVSISPPSCKPGPLTATTQSDKAVDLPVPDCASPGSSRGLQYVPVKAPTNGSLAGFRYTPAPGFIGQDEVAFRASNGFGESEPVTVRIFVVRAPAPPPHTGQNPAVKGAPYLTARVTPRLDRKRTTLVKLACDQNCTFAVRLTGTLKRPKQTMRSKLVTQTVDAGKVLSLRLRLPTRPKGTLKSVFVTGTVRNAAGEKRDVKLPVRLPR